MILAQVREGRKAMRDEGSKDFLEMLPPTNSGLRKGLGNMAESFKMCLCISFSWVISMFRSLSSSGVRALVKEYWDDGSFLVLNSRSKLGGRTRRPDDEDEGEEEEGGGISGAVWPEEESRGGWW